MNLLAYFLTLLLFVGPVILKVELGWPVLGFVEKSDALYLYPSFYFLLLISFYSIMKGRFRSKRTKYAHWIILITCIWFLFGYVFGGRIVERNIVFHSMALPAMYFVMYELLGDNDKVRSNIRNIILLMFVINAIFAIYERMTLSLSYPYDLIRSGFDYSFDDDLVFRSSALLGHPLTNALCMSIVMVFILLSNYNNIVKYPLLVLGFFSLFCFNSRAALMISTMTFVLYLLRKMFSKGTSWSRRVLLVTVLFCFVLLGLYLFNAGYGGRFEEQGDFSEDGSTLARIEVWNIFMLYGVSNFLWGLPSNEVEDISMAVLGMTHIENWFILSTMYVGLVLTVIIVVLFVPVYRCAVCSYNKYASFLIFLSVIVLASTNNSFATGIPALPIFFACCYAFSPIATDRDLKVDKLEKDNIA